MEKTVRELSNMVLNNRAKIGEVSATFLNESDLREFDGGFSRAGRGTAATYQLYSCSELWRQDAWKFPDPAPWYQNAAKLREEFPVLADCPKSDLWFEAVQQLREEPRAVASLALMLCYPYSLMDYILVRCEWARQKVHQRDRAAALQFLGSPTCGSAACPSEPFLSLPTTVLEIVLEYGLETTPVPLTVECMSSGGSVHHSYSRPHVWPSEETKFSFQHTSSPPYCRGRICELVHIYEPEHPDPRYTSECRLDMVVYSQESDCYWILQSWPQQPTIKFCSGNPDVDEVTRNEVTDPFSTDYIYY